MIVSVWVGEWYRAGVALDVVAQVDTPFEKMSQSRNTEACVRGRVWLRGLGSNVPSEQETPTHRKTKIESEAFAA